MHVKTKCPPYPYFFDLSSNLVPLFPLEPTKKCHTIDTNKYQDILQEPLVGNVGFTLGRHRH